MESLLLSVGGLREDVGASRNSYGLLPIALNVAEARLSRVPSCLPVYYVVS